MKPKDHQDPPSDQDDPRPAARPTGSRADVTSLIADIRRLGPRLLTPNAIDDPQVQSALHHLDKVMGSVLAPSRGKHRLRLSTADILARPESVPDASGYDLKPNPLSANSSAEYVAALRAYRSWAGNIPYRQMAERAQQAVAHNTMCVALNSTGLPALRVAIAIIVGCGGGAEDQKKFVTAWRRINSGDLGPPGLRVVGLSNGLPVAAVPARAGTAAASRR